MGGRHFRSQAYEAAVTGLEGSPHMSMPCVQHCSAPQTALLSPPAGQYWAAALAKSRHLGAGQEMPVRLPPRRPLHSGCFPWESSYLIKSQVPESPPPPGSPAVPARLPVASSARPILFPAPWPSGTCCLAGPGDCEPLGTGTARGPGHSQEVHVGWKWTCPEAGPKLASSQTHPGAREGSESGREGPRGEYYLQKGLRGPGWTEG